MTDTEIEELRDKVQQMLFAADGDDDLIEVPDIAAARSARARLEYGRRPLSTRRAVGVDRVATAS
jgi:hypothetical protein